MPLGIKTARFIVNALGVKGMPFGSIRELLKRADLLYPEVEMLRDYHRALRDAPIIEGLKYIPKGYAPTKYNLAFPDRALEKRFRFTVEVKWFNPELKREEVRTTRITADRLRIVRGLETEGRRRFTDVMRKYDLEFISARLIRAEAREDVLAEL